MHDEPAVHRTHVAYVPVCFPDRDRSGWQRFQHLIDDFIRCCGIHL